eukprot:scaffold31815_cov118-Isochrysis_galbana.AAC.11
MPAGAAAPLCSSHNVTYRSLSRGCPAAPPAARSVRVSKPASAAPGRAEIDSQQSHTSVASADRRRTAAQSRPAAPRRIASPIVKGTRVSRAVAIDSSASSPVSCSAASRSAGCTIVARRLGWPAGRGKSEAAASQSARHAHRCSSR